MTTTHSISWNPMNFVSKMPQGLEISCRKVAFQWNNFNKLIPGKHSYVPGSGIGGRIAPRAKAHCNNFLSWTLRNASLFPIRALEYRHPDEVLRNGWEAKISQRKLFLTKLRCFLNYCLFLYGIDFIDPTV